MSTYDLILTIVAAVLTLAGSFKAGAVQERRKAVRSLLDEIARSTNDDGGTR